MTLRINLDGRTLDSAWLIDPASWKTAVSHYFVVAHHDNQTNRRKPLAQAVTAIVSSPSITTV
jgi:hypothetical protein